MQALVLAGGSGTRFWPLSRRDTPKQLLALEGDSSLLRATVDRLAPLVPAASVWVVTTERLAAAVRAELPEVPPDQVLCEPEGRNTAAAIGWSVGQMARAGGDGVIAVLPADHRMGRPGAFRDTLAAAARVVESDDRVMTLGVTPRWAEPGYGYLELGEELPGEPGLRAVVRFTEKPEPEVARRFVDSGNYLWNGGIFVFRAARMLAEIHRLEPRLAAGLDEILERPEAVRELYPLLPAKPIDTAVMERLDDLATLPLDCEWSDLGGWTALAEILPTDESGNVERGDVVAIDCKDSLLFAAAGTIAAVGLEGAVVVRSGDAVLVVGKERAHEVKRIVAELGRRENEDLL